MSHLFRPRASFLQNSAWQNQALNALHYPTSQQGSVIPLVYGTCRASVNIIDLDGYRGPKGKKGKTGSLPLQGTSQTGKGGGGSKGKGKKNKGQYSVNVDFAICQGPVAAGASNKIFSSSGVMSFGGSGLHFYNGADGQAPDAHFNRLGYSGTAHLTGTPMNLGSSPVVPSVSIEITGLLVNQNAGLQFQDANPANVIVDFLTNPRYGAGFPAENLAPLLHNVLGYVKNTYGDYCQAGGFSISTVIDGHLKAIEWVDSMVGLTNSAIVWSGKHLNIIPYTAVGSDSNGAKWDPDFTPKYDLNDNHFLPWRPHQEGGTASPGEDDPIIMTRKNPADADNWLSMEFIDRSNYYNSTIVTSFDQGAIDTYGLRIGDSVNGRAFSALFPAQQALDLILRRRLYVMNTDIKFQIGWQFALLEPMDIVTLSGHWGDDYLNKYPVRIKSIEENDNGDLTVTAEEIQPGALSPYVANRWGVRHSTGDTTLIWPLGALMGDTLPPYNYVGWDKTHPPNSGTGTWSIWIQMPAGPTMSDSFNNYFGIMRTLTNDVWNILVEIAIGISGAGEIIGIFSDNVTYRSGEGALQFDGSWTHLLLTWHRPNWSVWVNGRVVGNTADAGDTSGEVAYSKEWGMLTFGWANFGTLGNVFQGCSAEIWFSVPEVVSNPAQFRSGSGKAIEQGTRGEAALGYPPIMYLYYLPTHTDQYADMDPNMPGLGFSYYGYNRAGFKPDDMNYWYETALGGVGSSFFTIYGDPAHPNQLIQGNVLGICDTNPYGYD